MIQSWENLLTDGRADAQSEANESDLMGRESDFIRVTSSVQNLIKINEITESVLLPKCLT